MTHAANGPAGPAKRRRAKTAEPKSKRVPPRRPAAREAAKRVRRAEAAHPAKRPRPKASDLESFFVPPKLPAPKDAAMRIRGADPAYARRLAGLGLIHCQTPAWDSVRKLFLPAVAAINASSYAPGIREGALIAILGDSHSGKTHILRRLSWHIHLQQQAGAAGLYRPLVMVKARAPSTMKGLGEDILTELRRRRHAPVQARNLSHRTAGDIWTEVRALLQAYGVSILVIDEVHNILVRDGAKDYEATAAAIKSLVIDDVWPMTVVLAGTKEKTGRLIDNSEELSQRAERVAIEPIAKGDAKQIGAFVAEIEAHLDLPQPSGLADGDRPYRFWFASQGHRGRIAKLIYRAAERAYATGRPRLDNALLADVLRRRYDVIDAINPFLLVTLANAQPIPDRAWRPDGDDDPPLKGNGRGRRK